MATSKKKTTKKEETPIEEEKIEVTAGLAQVIKEEKPVEAKKKAEPKAKYSVGSIVYIKKEAEADLEGFKLFPQYKKYAYTVEAYDAKSGVYSLRRLNLSLKLKEDLIINPDEKAHDIIGRKQF